MSCRGSGGRLGDFLPKGGDGVGEANFPVLLVHVAAERWLNWLEY